MTLFNSMLKVRTRIALTVAAVLCFTACGPQDDLGYADPPSVSEGQLSAQQFERAGRLTEINQVAEEERACHAELVDAVAQHPLFIRFVERNLDQIGDLITDLLRLEPEERSAAAERAERCLQEPEHECDEQAAQFGFGEERITDDLHQIQELLHEVGLADAEPAVIEAVFRDAVLAVDVSAQSDRLVERVSGETECDRDCAESLTSAALNTTALYIEDLSSAGAGDDGVYGILIIGIRITSTSVTLVGVIPDSFRKIRCGVDEYWNLAFFACRPKLDVGGLCIWNNHVCLSNRCLWTCQP